MLLKLSDAIKITLFLSTNCEVCILKLFGMKKENLNKIQLTAYELIQSDAMFIYALTMIAKKENKIQTNYMCMSLPYIGVFTDGAAANDTQSHLNSSFPGRRK